MAFNVTTSGSSGIVSTTSSGTTSPYGLQQWTWAFWFRRISNPTTARTVLISGPDAVTGRSIRLLHNTVVGGLRITYNGTGTDANYITQYACSTDWRLYVITGNWNATPTVTGFMSDSSGGIAALTWNTSTNSTGTLNKESTEQLSLLNNPGLASGCAEGAIGPFALWNRVFTLAEATSILHGGPLAQPSGLLAWVPAYMTAYGNPDWAGNAINWSGHNALLTHVPDPPVIWGPSRTAG